MSVVPTVRQLNQADCSQFKINPGYTLTQAKSNWIELEPSGMMGDLSLFTEGKTVPGELSEILTVQVSCGTSAGCAS